MAHAEELARDLGTTGDRLVGRPSTDGLPLVAASAPTAPIAPAAPASGPAGGRRAAGDAVAGPIGMAGVAALAERVRPTDLAGARNLPVLPALAALLPAAGLRRGTTAAVDARAGVTGATSLALALAAGASQAGSWVAAVGLGSLGLVAAAELGVALERLVLVAHPGDGPAGWASVVAALVDGFDVVLVAAGGGRMRPADARRLVARVREREAVLVAVGGDLPGERSPLRLTVTSSTWQGLGEGWGNLQGRRVAVEVAGRGESARGGRAELWLPDADGAVAVVEPVASAVPLRRRRPLRAESAGSIEPAGSADLAESTGAAAGPAGSGGGAWPG